MDIYMDMDVDIDIDRYRYAFTCIGLTRADVL